MDQADERSGLADAFHKDPMSDRMVLTSDWPVISQIVCTLKWHHYRVFIQSGQCDGRSSP